MRIATLMGAVMVLAGCSASGDPPACHPGIPLASQLRQDPAFEALKFHVYQQPKPLKPIPYDVWADAKFEYLSALEYALATKKDAKSFGDECAYAVSLRFAYPGREIDRRKLTVFTQAVAPAAGMDAKTLEKSMLDVISSGDKYRPRKIEGKAEIEAGRLFHPTRGDFFMFTVTWPKPEGSTTIMER